MLRRTGAMIALSGMFFCFGCYTVDRGIPSEQRQASAGKPLKTSYSCELSTILEKRYLLLPIRLDDEGKDKFYAPSAIVVSSAWSGLGSSGYNQQRVNVEIVDLATGSHHRVFSHPVALGTWDLSLATGQGGAGAASPAWTPYFPRREGAASSDLRFSGLLFLEARTEDTNNDGQLNHEDPIWVFAHDLGSQELKRISPDGYTVMDSTWNDRVLIMTARRMGTDEVAVYGYEPGKGQGRFIVQGLTP